MHTTYSSYKKGPEQTEKSDRSGYRNTAKTDAAALAATLKKGPDGSIRLALSTSEAADALGVSVRTLHRLRERNLIKPSRALRTMVWPIGELVKFLETTR